MSNRIEDLEIYQLSEIFADVIWELVTAWEWFAKDTVGKQFVRSADSISANIAEGFCRFHYKENKNFAISAGGQSLKPKAGSENRLKEV